MEYKNKRELARTVIRMTLKGVPLTTLEQMPGMPCRKTIQRWMKRGAGKGESPYNIGDFTSGMRLARAEVFQERTESAFQSEMREILGETGRPRK